jgi:hypothetical protein
MATQPTLRGNNFAISRDLNPTFVSVEALKPLGRETRKHPPAQIRKVQVSIERFGIVLPILVDPAGRVIDGWRSSLQLKSWVCWSFLP